MFSCRFSAVLCDLGHRPDCNSFQMQALGHSVGGEVVVVLAVTASSPQQQRGGHHVQRRGDERQIEGPTERAVHLDRDDRDTVQQVHTR